MEFFLLILFCRAQKKDFMEIYAFKKNRIISYQVVKDLKKKQTNTGTISDLLKITDPVFRSGNGKDFLN